MTREELEAKRDELMQRLEAIRQDIRGGVDRDAEERVDQVANREVLEAIYRSTEAELERRLREAARAPPRLQTPRREARHLQVEAAALATRLADSGTGR